MDEEIRNLIEAREIEAIVLDTEAFDSQHLSMESGLLQRVAQFAHSAITVLMPDVVEKEVMAHLVKANIDAQGQLKQAIKQARQTRLIVSQGAGDGEPLSQLIAQLAQPEVATEVAAHRLSEWKQRTGAIVLTAGEYITLDQVMQRYFSSEPPFAATGAKKHEFPDAVALLSLERWAVNHDTKVLVVSNDSDWERYCATSAHLFLVKDLSSALGAFQNETAGYAARRLAELLDRGDPVGLRLALEDALTRQGDVIDFVVNADSQFEYEDEGVEAVFGDVELPRAEIAAVMFEAVDHGDGNVSVQVSGTVKAEVVCSFSFQKWDSIDREYMSMGGGQTVTDEDVEFDAIVTLSGRIPDRMVIESVEVLPTTHYLELNGIEPDWMSDPDNYGDDMD